MAGNLFYTERGVVISTVDAGVDNANEFDAVCAEYGAAQFVGGILLDAEVARVSGGPGNAMASIRQHGSHRGVVGIYDRVRSHEDETEIPGAFAERMAATGIGAVLLHPTEDNMAWTVQSSLLDFGIESISVIGAKDNVTEFSADKAWSELVGKMFDQGVRAFWVPGNASESVGRLYARLIQLAPGVGDIALLAACPNTPALERTLLTTDTNLHVVVPPDLVDDKPDIAISQTLRYVHAQAQLSRVV